MHVPPTPAPQNNAAVHGRTAYMHTTACLNVYSTGDLDVGCGSRLYVCTCVYGGTNTCCCDLTQSVVPLVHLVFLLRICAYNACVCMRCTCGLARTCLHVVFTVFRAAERLLLDAVSACVAIRTSCACIILVPVLRRDERTGCRYGVANARLILRVLLFLYSSGEM